MGVGSEFGGFLRCSVNLTGKVTQYLGFRGWRCLIPDVGCSKPQI